MIRLVALDVDGVLSDGRITYGDWLAFSRFGENSANMRLVSFFSRDMHGLAIDADYNIRFREFCDIAVGKTGIAAEKKNITHLFESLNCDLLFSYQQQLLFI